MNTPTYFSKLDQVSFLNGSEREQLSKVTKRFEFLTNEYYLNLIDCKDPQDPIRRIVVPSPDELNDDGGKLDASQEYKYTIIPGLQHKYGPVALALVSKRCGGYCRFCFRKRLFNRDHCETLKDWPETLKYLRLSPQISDLLLTGGDPLLLPTARLEMIITRVRSINHIKVIRLGSKIAAYYPFRISHDPSLLELFKKYSKPEQRIYVITHFNHPRELTGPSIEAIRLLQKAGVILANQTPLLRGINDNPVVLSKLFKRLSSIGVPPYYVFQCRPTLGNKTYALPIEEAYTIFEQARSTCSGLAKRAKFVMSHSTGKIEIIGITHGQIYMKYHSAADSRHAHNMLIFNRNSDAYWLEDYYEEEQEFHNLASR